MKVVERLEGPPPPPPNREGLYYGRGETEASKQRKAEWELLMKERAAYYEAKRAEYVRFFKTTS